MKVTNHIVLFEWNEDICAASRGVFETPSATRCSHNIDKRSKFWCCWMHQVLWSCWECYAVGDPGSGWYSCWKVSLSCFSISIIFVFVWWKYFICEIRSYINKIVGYELVYILVGLIFLLPYSFGKQWTSLSVCASKRSWPVSLWARAHRCPVSTRVSHNEIMWRIVTT